MTFYRQRVTNAAIGVAVTETPQGLSAIHRPDCAAAIWERSPLRAFQAWLDDLAPSQLPQARVVCRPAAVRTAALQICDASGMPDQPERQRLIDDIAALADIFAGVMQVRYLRLRLNAVTGNDCGRFHIDAIAARLLCTYRGPGTQYGISTDGSEPGRIFTVPTGAPIVLRGTQWQGGWASGLLHRAPPLEEPQETRLVLAMDPVDERSIRGG